MRFGIGRGNTVVIWRKGESENMAYMYHNNGYNDGYSPSDVKATGKMLGISKIAKLEEDKLSALMEWKS